MSSPTPIGHVRRGEARTILAMWGPTFGGKTTFLHALNTAVLQRDASDGEWKMWGTTVEDNASLAAGTQQLRDKEFPRGTVKSDEFNWHLSGSEPRGPVRRALRLKGRPIQLGMGIYDIPGESFRPGSAGAAEATSYLDKADGILYLYDPTLDLGIAGAESKAERDNFEYFAGVVAELQRMGHTGGTLVDNRLRQHLAVCVVKFDSRPIFRLAMEEGWVSEGRDPAHQPRIADSDARAYFDVLCDRTKDTTAGMLRNLIEVSFVPQRVRFFVTSAIGFHVGDSGRFDERDPDNVEVVDGVTRLRGTVRPINVLEPLIWLEQGIRKAR